MPSEPLGGWGRKFDVLKHGFVRVVDRMGDDSAVVQAARVSYGAGTKTVHEDEGLIRFLMRHRHTSPFEMCEIKFHVKVPMDTWRQWIRHRTASVNEYSTRYSEAIDEQHIPDANEFRKQTKLNRQGSGTMLSPQDGEQLRNETIELFGHVTKVYKNRLRFGVAREQAREVLPLSNYTEAYWKIDLHNLLNFLSLRMDSQAQEEIRLFANVIARIVQEWVPLTWNAFRDYRLEGMHLSKRDIDAIWLRKVDIDVVFRTLLKWSWIRKNHDPTAIPVYRLTKNRERDECERKLHRLDMSVPWANLRHAPKK